MCIPIPAERVQNRGRSRNIEFEEWLQNGYNEKKSAEAFITFPFSLSKSLEVRMLHTEPAIGFEPMTC
jgi:hypothetical protein